jgi:hypothetical protein
MRRWKRFVFVLIAYAMALLHTAVPHQHSQRAAGETSIYHAGCIVDESMGGFLKKLFSTDLGYGHLETFQKSADTDIDFLFTGVSIIALLVPILLILVVAPLYRELLEGYIGKIHKRLLLLSASHFRAPPVF